jgi:hypothetical protein
MASLWAEARLVLDILSMKMFVWALGRLFPWALGTTADVLDSHLFFFDRYSALAACHRLRGRIVKADRFAAIAEAYYSAAPDDDDDPPEAAAMAMPVPRPPVNTNAVSEAWVTRRPAARPSGLRPSPAR